MKALRQRIARLERADQPALSPSIRRWLGEALTPAEALVADSEEQHSGSEELDIAEWPSEFRSWWTSRDQHVEAER